MENINIQAGSDVTWRTRQRWAHSRWCSPGAARCWRTAERSWAARFSFLPEGDWETHTMTSLMEDGRTDVSVLCAAIMIVHWVFPLGDGRSRFESFRPDLSRSFDLLHAHHALAVLSLTKHTSQLRSRTDVCETTN